MTFASYFQVAHSFPLFGIHCGATKITATPGPQVPENKKCAAGYRIFDGQSGFMMVEIYSL